MEKNIAIEFNNVGKQYRLGLVGTGSLQHDLNRWWQTTILGKEDPYLKIGEVNDRSKKGTSDYVWALKDISFKVEQGDVLGIIGKNGAGKSTLLKLLSHITAPSTGDIRYRGRIASLLEVGTGFHPEMTARENIYMNGSIMGMTRHEITGKLDEIVDFAGIERYLDTPVKRFSSGMTVRLGFAVAAFLEPEILVVDEVLAVGDAEFQKKAIGKMKDVSSSGGRTVLFVSHNMAAVRTLCNNGIVLKNGMIDYVGTSENCVDYYLNNNITQFVDYTVVTDKHRAHSIPREIEFIDVRMLNDVKNVSSEEPLCFEFTIRKNNENLKECQFGIIVRNNADVCVGAGYSEKYNLPEKKEFKILIKYPYHQLSKGIYSINFSLAKYNYKAAIHDYDWIRQVISFEVTYLDNNHHIPLIEWPSHFGSMLFRNEQVEFE